MSNVSFEQAVRRFRTAIMSRAQRNDQVSSVDLMNVVPSATGGRRGAIVRRAFESLIGEARLVRSGDTVYNQEHRHRVSTYVLPRRRKAAVRTKRTARQA